MNEDMSILDHRDLFKVEKIFKENKLKTYAEKEDFADENFDGQLYLYYSLSELQKILALNLNKPDKKFTFSASALDNLLRSFSEAIPFMHENTPEGEFDYCKSKLFSFKHQLVTQLDGVEDERKK